MAAHDKGPEAASLNLGVLRRFSLPNAKSSPSATPNGVNAFRDILAASPSSTSSSSAKPEPTAFQKLKYQLGKRRKVFREKGADHSPPKTPNGTAATPAPDEALHETVESTCETTSEIPQSHKTGDEGVLRSENHSPNQCVDIETDNPGADDSCHTMSAAAFARRIRSLLSSLPPFYTNSNQEPSGDLKGFDPAATTHEPGAGSPLADSKFLSLLSSTSAMNGSISKGRESVWAILERLGYSPGEKSKSQERSECESGAPLDEDNVEVSSVMICGPLEPTEDTEVELARSDIVSIDMEEPVCEPETPKQRSAGIRLWPFGKEKEGKGKGKGKGKEETISLPEQQKSPPVRIKEVRVWYPSRTKISLQAAWWGYRIYLPPPVMRVLNDKSLEAAKRAAIITAALTWLISHIPTTMLPPQLRAAVGVVKGIVPIIGYVGGFIAWSWNTVQSFDKGQGVILSATWLLPIALVPGTWLYTEPLPSNSPSNPDVTSEFSRAPSPPPKDSPA